MSHALRVILLDADASVVLGIKANRGVQGRIADTFTQNSVEIRLRRRCALTETVPMYISSIPGEQKSPKKKTKVALAARTKKQPLTDKDSHACGLTALPLCIHPTLPP